MTTSRRPLSLTSRVISILLYVGAGFFLYSAGLIAFFSAANSVPYFGKLAIAAVFCGLGIIPLCGGFVVTQFRHWERDLGIVFLTSAALIAFVSLSIFCMCCDPGVRKMYPQLNLDAFSDFITGIIYLVALTSTGAAFLRISKQLG